MTSQSEYTRYLLDRIEAICRPVPNRNGLSDTDIGNEYYAAVIIKNAYDTFVALATEAAAKSELRRDQINEMLAQMQDMCPDFEAWSEDVSAARRGWDE